MNKLIDDCPVCGSTSLYVERVCCSDCKTAVEGVFDMKASGIMPDLDDELRHFLKVFIFAEGNIKQTERLMNCSYPKVKNYLKKIKSALSLDVVSENVQLGYEEVLQKVEKGEMSVVEAMKYLK